MRKVNLTELERYVKKCIKGRYKFSKALVISFLISGLFSGISYGANVWLNVADIPVANGENSEIINITKKSQVMYEGAKKENIPDEATILSDYRNKTGVKTAFSNQDFNKTVIIGSRTAAGGHGGTAIGFGAITGENTNTINGSKISDIDAENKLKNNEFIINNPNYSDFKKRYDDAVEGKWFQIDAIKRKNKNKVIQDFKKQFEKDMITKGKNLLNQEGTAVGYKSFARGNEATALGNDVVAWGDSSIAIGSDNASDDVNQKALSEDIFALYYNARADFNDTSSYAAVKFEKPKEDSKGIIWSETYSDSNSILRGEDGEEISRQDGRVYIRKNNKNWDAGWYVYRDGEFYETQDDKSLKKVKDDSKEKEIKKLKDWARYEKYKKDIEKKYNEYLNDPLKTKSHTWARGNNSIAIGARSVAFGKNSTALGTFAFAGRDYSTALGSNTLAFGQRSLAVGNEAYVYANESVGVGNNVQAINNGSMVYGANSYAGGLGSLAIGDHTFANITMIDKFNNDENAIPKEQLTDSYNKDNYTSTIDIEELYEKGNTKDIQDLGKEFFAAKTVEQKGTKEQKAEQSIDKKDKHPNQGAIAIGSYSVALGNNAISLGRYAYAKLNDSVAIGKFAFSKGDSAFSLGSFSRALGENSFAVGKNAYAEKADSMAIGVGSKATFDNSIALGVNSETDYTTEELQKDAWAPKYSVSLPHSQKIGYLSVGGKDAERRIVNVAPGSSDTDAVNVSQLRALEEMILYGNTLEENNVNSGVNYVSVKGINELKLLVTKEQDYKNYIKVKKEYLKLKARKLIGGESINIEELDKKLKKYESRYGDFAEKSSKLQAEYNNNAYDLVFPDADTEEVKNRKRKERLKTKITEIDNAYTIDEKANVLTDEERNKIEISNFNSDGAKASGSIAIGVGAKTDVANAVILGSNVDINQVEKNKKGAVVAIGNGVKLSNSKGSIGIGTIHEGDEDTNRTTINNSEWSILVGNKSNINGGNDIVALGSNISVTKKETSNQNNVNNNLIILGNKAKAQNAKSSVIIGSETESKSPQSLVLGYQSKISTDSDASIAIGVSGETKIENSKWAIALGNKIKILNSGNNVLALGSNLEIGENNENLIIIGDKATATNAKYSVVIGEKAKSYGEKAVSIGKEAKVENNAGDSIAIGNESEATAKETAQSSATITGKNVKFTFAGGVSSDNNDDNKKTVFSVGKSGKERIIKNVAAGAVTSKSTDAINGSQLYAVADEFSKLAIDVLGAEADTAEGKTGFKKSQFKALKAKITDVDTAIEKTFKQAISDNIDQINKGFTFSDGTNKGQRYFGQEVTIQAGNIEGEKFDSNNIKTNYAPNTGTFLIGIKKSPTFDMVTINNSPSKGTDAINKTYLDSQLLGKANSSDVYNKSETYSKEQLDQKISAIPSANLTDYAKLDASNVTDDDKQSKWREKLNVYSKLETNNAVDKAKEKVVQGTGIKVETTPNSDEGPKTFTVSIDDNIKAKIDKIAEGNVIANDEKTVTGGKVYDAIKNSKTTVGVKENDYITVSGNKTESTSGDTFKLGLDIEKLKETLKNSFYETNATFGLIGNDSVAVTRTLNNNISIKGSETAKSGGTNIYVSSDNSSSPTGLKIELGETLSGIKNISNGNSKIILDNDGVKIKHGADAKESKIVNEDQFNELNGGSEIQINGGGKVLGESTSLSLKNNSIEGSKLKNNTIGIEKLDDSLKNKIKNLVKSNQVIKGDSNIKQITKDNTTKLSLNKDLKGIDSIGRYEHEGTNKITFIGKNLNTSIAGNSLRNNVTIHTNGGIFEFNRTGLHINTKEITGVKSGLYDEDEKKDSAEKDKKNIELARKFIEGNSNGKLHNASNLNDLRYLGLLGLDFEGNNSNELVHRNLGQKLVIKGDQTSKQKTFESAKDNINVEAKDGELTVQLSKKLKNLTSAEFDGKITYGNSQEVSVKTKLDAEGLELEEKDTTSTELLKKTEYKLGKAVFKEAKKDNSDKKETEITHEGTLIRDIKGQRQSKYYADGTTINEIDEHGTEKQNGKSAEYKLEGSKVTDGTNTLETNAKTISLKHKTSDSTKEEVFTITNETGKVTVDFKNKDENGKFTGKITGLADITDDASGDTAVNKKYVDDIKNAIINNKPVGEIKDKFDKEKINEKLSEASKKQGNEKNNAIKEILKEIGITDTNKQDELIKKSVDEIISELVKNDKSLNAVSGDTIKKYLTANYYDKNEISKLKIKIKDEKNTTGNDISLTNGLTFKGDNSIKATVDSNGNVTYSLNNAIELKDDKGKNIKTIAVNNKGNLVVREEGKNTSVENDVITSANIGNQTISYKSNSKGAKTVKLSEGLDFTNTDNIQAEVDDDGVVKHKLVNSLKGIDSISNTNDENGSKITLSKIDNKNKIELTLGTVKADKQNQGTTIIPTKFIFSEEGLDLEGKKITGVETPTEEKDAVNKKYVDDQLAKVNSDSLVENIYHDDEGNEVVKHTDGKYYKKDDTEKNNGKDASKVKEIVKIKGSDKQITNVSSGLGLTDKNQDELKKKASTYKEELNKQKEELAKKEKEIADLEKNKTNKEKELVELKKDQNKNSLEIENATGALDQAKGKIEELNKEKTKLEETIKQKQAEISKLEESLDSEKVKQLVNDKLTSKEKNVATIRDLKEVAKSGINFKGNDDKELNIKISDTLSIKGEGDTKAFTSATGNIRVESSDKTMTIKLSDSLKNMTSFETKDYANGNGSKIDASGLTVKGDGSEAVYGKDSIVFKKGDTEIIKIDGSKGELTIPDITDKSSDNAAVNKKYVDTIRTNVDEQVSGLKGGVAGAMAMANLVQANSFSDYRHQLSAAFGAYDGKQALAVGYSGITKNRRLVYKLSGSVDSLGKLGFGAGIGIMLGEKNEQTPNNYPQKLAKEVETLKKENKEYKEDIKRLTEKLNKIEKDREKDKERMKKEIIEELLRAKKR